MKARERMPLGKQLFWLVLFGVAFGYLEASVVIYLRELYYPGGFHLPLVVPGTTVMVVEPWRELSTLLMLLAVAWVAGESGWERFGVFCLLFGIWDLVFYAALRVVTGWPESLLTWDLLFLLPRPWSGPVLSAVLVAASLCVTGTVFIRRAREGFRPWAGWPIWIGALLSLAILLESFFLPSGVAEPGGRLRFPWALYGVGFLLGWATFLVSQRRGTKGEPG